MQFQRAYPILAIAIGLGLLVYATFPGGIGLSEDSISYLSAARSLHNSGEMLDIDGSYFVAWAPLYPLILSLLQIRYDEVETYISTLNLILFALTAISSWTLIRNAIEKPFFRAACMFSILFSFTLMQVYSVALTEAMFLWLVNLVLIQLTTKDQESGKWTFVPLAFICAVILSLRYPGIFVIPVVIYFLVKKKRTSPGEMLVFAAICFTPITIWLIRNWTLTETLTGFRASGGEFFFRNLTVLAETITSWILPLKVPLLIRLVALGSVILLLRKGFFEKKNRYHLLIFGSYLLMLIIAYAFFSFEEPRDRLLAPVFIPIFILLFSGLEHFGRRFTAVPYPVVVAVVCLWMFYPASRIVKHVQLWHEEGVEVYNKPAWKNSKTMEWVKEYHFPPKIFSNDAHAIYYFTGKNACRVPKYFYSTAQLEEAARKGGVLVWWKKKEYYDLKFLQEHFHFELWEEFDDAMIIGMRRK